MSQEQFDKIMFLINKGVEEGAKLEVGGKRYGAALLAVPVSPLCVHRGWQRFRQWLCGSTPARSSDKGHAGRCEVCVT